MERAIDAAHLAWKNAVIDVFQYLYNTLGVDAEITSDNVWKELNRQYPNVRTHEPRAMGPIFSRMAKARLIEKTGQYIESTRPENHQRPIPVWRFI